MKVFQTRLADTLVIEPQVFRDARGFFYESFNEAAFAQVIRRPVRFVQDNQSFSVKNVVRGLHYQIRQPQGKLIRVIRGEILDVALDIRRHSPTYGQWTSIRLSADNKRIFWIPEGFAHGFAVLSDEAEISYKTTDYWAPVHERCILWNDSHLQIDWHLSEPAIVSDKDQQGNHFLCSEVFE